MESKCSYHEIVLHYTNKSSKFLNVWSLIVKSTWHHLCHVDDCQGEWKSALPGEVTSKDQDTGLVCSVLNVAWIKKI